MLLLDPNLIAALDSEPLNTFFLTLGGELTRLNAVCFSPALALILRYAAFFPLYRHLRAICVRKYCFPFFIKFREFQEIFSAA